MKCRIDGCEKETHRRDLCNAHYQKLLKYGNPCATKQAPPNNGICAVEGCNLPSRTRADTPQGRYCEKHYMRKYRTGTLQGHKEGRCRSCGKELPDSAFRFCSPNCRSLSRSPGAERLCVICGKSFRAYGSSITCSKDCRKANDQKLQLKHKTKIRGTWLLFFNTTWQGMNARTINGSHPNPKAYKSYLDKGVQLQLTRDQYKQWCNNKKLEIEQMYHNGDRPSIDRINPDTHYSIDNIRVLPLKENTSKGRKQTPKPELREHRLAKKRAYANLKYQEKKAIEEDGGFGR